MNHSWSKQTFWAAPVCIIVFAVLQAHFEGLFFYGQQAQGQQALSGQRAIGLRAEEKINVPTRKKLNLSTEDKTMPIELRDYPLLPEGLSSFGGAVYDGWLYVYSGHTGGAHDHSRENLSQRFQRLQLTDGEVWEELPMQTPLQGLALVAHKTGLYRIGGLNARNAPEEEEDLVSLAEFSRFDPQSGQWSRLADMPHARSSHDAVVIGNRIYVAGGWTLGSGGEGEWLDSALVFDLTDPDGAWEPLPQAPFERRALAVSHWQGKLVVAGGIDSAGDISFSLDFYDPSTKIWSKGPRVPGKGMNAFGLSAWNLEDELYLCGFGGVVYKLAADGMSWKEVLTMQTARFFHQLLPGDSKSLLAVAGASRHGHLTDIERLQVLKSPEKMVKAEHSQTSSSTGAEPAVDNSLSIELSGPVTDSWPGFRGMGNSVSHAKDLPLHWDDEQGILWSVDLPGYGQSSPIVWRSRVYVTTMQGAIKETPTILCFDISTGQEQWRREFESSQQVAVSNYVTRGAPTPVLDASGVYAFFESGELISLNHEGEPRWHRSLVTDYGLFQGNHGIGSSLAATEDGVVVLVNQDGPSYLMAVNKQDGGNLWKVDYAKRVAWSSPVVTEYHGQQIVIVSANGHVEAYQANSGEILWNVEGLSGNNVPSATVVDEVVYVGSKDASSNVAIRFTDTTESATEEATESGSAEIFWRSKKQTCSFSSPLCYRGFVYTVSRAGVAYCADASSGQIAWKERLGDSCWTSPVGAGERIYFFTKSGKSIVVSHGKNYKLLAENKISIDAKTRIYGVALVDGKLLLRTGSRLICVGH